MGQGRVNLLVQNWVGELIVGLLWGREVAIGLGGWMWAWLWGTGLVMGL